MQDDLDYANEEYAPSGGIARWVPAAVVLTAVGGFIGLAWYAYNAGVQSLDEGDLLVIEADKTPVKEKPDDPGGMQFPNQDKTVFDTFAGGNSQPANAERLLPAPEQPIAQLDASLAEAAKAPENTGAPEQVIGTPAEKPAEKVAEKPAEKPAEKTTAAAEPAKPEVKEASPSVGTSAAAPAVKEEPKEQKVAALTTESIPGVSAKSSSAGKAKIQLGAYRSEQEANRAWGLMQKKFSSLSGHSPTIVKADLGAKGVYYRLRVGGFADAAAARDFCKGLSAKGQACILAN